MQFAEITGADIAWLLTGHERPAPAIPGSLAHAIPLITEAKTLRTIAEAFEQKLVKKSADWMAMIAGDHQIVTTRAKASAIAFATYAPDQAMQPRIEASDIVVVDGDAKLGANDTALYVLVGTDEILIRRLESGRLTASNPLFPPREIAPAHRLWCAGKVIESSRSYELEAKSTASLALPLASKV